MELRAEMTAAAEERIIAVTSQKEANLNVQQVVDRHTRELKVSINTPINIGQIPDQFREWFLNCWLMRQMHTQF